jgi:hypothetical protein
MKGFAGALAAIALTLLARGTDAQTHDCAHSQEVRERGDHVMGFDHMKTTHHFRLTKSGGQIQVEANDAADTESRDQIRAHLAHIARMFAEGDFQAPMLIHGQVPPGVPVMKERRKAIRYEFVETPRGGKVVVTTSDSRALAAVHDFLRFQIRDHETGDPMKIEAAG